MPVTSGHLPCRYFAFFFVLPLRMAIKYTLIYICVCVCVFITVMEDLCHYTPKPLCP
jgi:cytochrome c oxidase subunit IV